MNINQSFVDGYIRLVWAAANKDPKTLLDVSTELGFLTGTNTRPTMLHNHLGHVVLNIGQETPEMISAHVDAGMVVGEPFLSREPFNFADSKLTARIGQYGGIFMKYRLTPPPSEAYSLHRKLAGAFLLCIKLKAIIPCRDLLEEVYQAYPFDEHKGVL